MYGIEFQMQLPIEQLGIKAQNPVEELPEESFEDVLNDLTDPDTTVETTKSADIKKVEEALELIAKLEAEDAPISEIENVIKSLSTEQNKILLELIEGLLEKISEEIAGEQDSSTTTISDFDELFKSKNDNEIENAIYTILQQLLALLQKNSTVEPLTGVSTQTRGVETLALVTSPTQALGTQQINQMASSSTLTITTDTITPQTQNVVENSDNQTQTLAQATTVTDTQSVAETQIPTIEVQNVVGETVDVNVNQTTAIEKLQILQTAFEKLTNLGEMIEKTLTTVTSTEEVNSPLINTQASNEVEILKLSAQSQGTKFSVLTSKIYASNLELDEITASNQVFKMMGQPVINNEISAPIIEISVDKQVANAVTEQLTTKVIDNNTQEMTLMLKPAELGEISIKLIKNGSEITISILAQLADTQRLLQEKLPSLISSLQASNSDVKDVQVVTANTNASSFLSGFNLSDSNSNSQYNAQQLKAIISKNGTVLNEIDEIVETQNEYIREGILWQTV